MKKFQIVGGLWGECNAGMKAPKDVADILEREGFVRLNLDVGAWLRRCGRFGAVIWLVVAVVKARRFGRGSIGFVQFPSPICETRSTRLFMRWLNGRGVCFVGLIHDLAELQHDRSENGLLPVTKFLMDICEKVIVHNQAMKKWLVERKVGEDKLVELGVFDYLVGHDDWAVCGSSREIVVAGNLSPKKCGYIYHVGNLDEVRFNVYGMNNAPNLAEQANVSYKGAFLPDELIPYLQGGWGLVWDGDSVEECAGVAGRYLLYNNPHKVSLYLAAGLPVIVWARSALAKFVVDAGIGIAVDSLRDLPEKLNVVGVQRYDTLVANVRHVAERLRSGCYLSEALERATNRCGS